MKNIPLNRKSRVKCATIKGHKSYVNWVELPPGEFRDDEVKPERLPKATLAGHERPKRRTKSWGSGSRVIRRDPVKAAFYGD